MSEPFEFEGTEVTDFTAQLPSASLEAPEAYPRGTILTLSVQVRVKSVQFNEDRTGKTTRKHVLALEDVSISDVLTPQQRQILIAAAQAEAEAAAALEHTTVTEQDHIDDVLDDEDEEADDDDDDGPGFEEIVALVSGQPRATLDDDPDADHEHDWMDEEEDSVGALRVEVEF